MLHLDLLGLGVLGLLNLQLWQRLSDIVDGRDSLLILGYPVAPPHVPDRSQVVSDHLIVAAKPERLQNRLERKFAAALFLFVLHGQLLVLYDQVLDLSLQGNYRFLEHLVLFLQCPLVLDQEGVLRSQLL